MVFASWLESVVVSLRDTTRGVKVVFPQSKIKTDSVYFVFLFLLRMILWRLASEMILKNASGVFCHIQ